MKKIISILITICCLGIMNNYQVNASDDCTAYTDKTGFPLFKYRSKCICDDYKPKVELKIIEDEYEEIEKEYNLGELSTKYKTDMNDLYKCALLSSQKKALVMIKDDLIKVNVDLLERLTPKLEEKIMLIDLSLAKLECKEPKDKNSIIKKTLLLQTTYETCKYTTYLEYLRDTNDTIENLVPDTENPYPITKLYRDQFNKNEALDEEILNIFKVFPLAFDAYTEYENNIITHFLLELLQEDFTIYKEKLHLVLNPINQVIYKVSNAMRKQ